MTCIVGIRQGGRIWIGGDSAGTDRDGRQLVRADTKVFTWGEFVFGFCGSYRMGQLLRYNLEPPVPREDVDAAEYMTTEFLDAVRDVLKEGGCAKVKDGVERGGDFLVGWRGELYQVHSDFQVAIPAAEYAATGSGVELALGSLYTTRHQRSPAARIQQALEAAAAYDAYVAGPFHVLSS